MENSPVRLALGEDAVGHKADRIPGEEHVQETQPLLVACGGVQAHGLGVSPDESAEPLDPKERHSFLGELNGDCVRTG